MPLPRRRSFLPLDVPGGTFTSALPSIVGDGRDRAEDRAIERDPHVRVDVAALDA